MMRSEKVETWANIIKQIIKKNVVSETEDLNDLSENVNNHKDG